MSFIALDRNILTFIEAIAVALLAVVISYVLRVTLVNLDGVGATGFTWRAIGLAAGLPILCAVYYLSDRHWLGVALAAAGIGLIYGLGPNEVLFPQSIGQFWDIQALWYYTKGSLITSHPSYSFYTSVAWVSLIGVLTALFGIILSFGILETTLKELRRSQSHKGTNRYRSRETVFGDAKWGSWPKIRNLIGDPNGIVLGEDYDPRQSSKVYNIIDEKSWGLGGKADLITMSPKFEGGHVMVFSGPGGGKTAGIVIPTCLTYNKSVIVVDPEFEILKATEKARKSMDRDVRVIKIGEGVNLLKFLERLTDRRDQVFAHLAKMITDPSRAHTSDVSDFFAKEAKNIIAGLLNYYSSKNVENPFFEVLKVISKQEEDFKNDIKEIVDTQDDDSLLKITLASYSKMESKTFTSFQSTVKQALEWAPYKELLDIITNEPDGAADPLGPNTDLYIQISKSDMENFPGLIRLIVGTLAYVVDEKPDGHERMMIVDEAYQVGRLKIFEKIRDTSRKRHLHLMQIFQTSGQLEELYGHAGVRAWNNTQAARIYSTTSDAKDQEELSKLIGEYTADIEGSSKSSSVRGLGLGTPTASASQNTSLRNVRLMRPEQLGTLPNDALIILFKGFNPIICGKAICFRRKEWQKFTPFIKSKRA